MSKGFKKKVACRGVIDKALTLLCYRKLGWSEALKRWRQPTDRWEKLHGLDCLVRNLMKLEEKVKKLLNMYTRGNTRTDTDMDKAKLWPQCLWCNVQIISKWWMIDEWRLNFHTNVGEHTSIVTLYLYLIMKRLQYRKHYLPTPEARGL